LRAKADAAEPSVKQKRQTRLSKSNTPPNKPKQESLTRLVINVNLGVSTWRTMDDTLRQSYGKPGGCPRKIKAEPKSSKIGAESSKARPNLAKENPWISFAESSVINELR
jgi:hypothetical protein